eukprot:921409-Amorphochlora_amoeboformis.AAC.1
MPTQAVVSSSTRRNRNPARHMPLILSVEELASWHGLAFQDVAFNVLTKFTRDHLPEHALKAIIEE